jgi:ATP-binding cassette, subfamily B, bacterial
VTAAGQTVDRWTPDRVPRFLLKPEAFIWHYLVLNAPLFLGLLLSGVGAASCAVGVQYAMKILVDAIGGARDSNKPWLVLAVFMSLIALESVLWRVTGWLTCRATVGAGVQMRADLFRYLAGQPMRYFAENLAGSLGQRITSTAGNFGALSNAFVWRVLPPCVDFFGAMFVFSLIDARLMIALFCSVACVTAGLIFFGERGRPLHAKYAEFSNSVGGDLTDVISNMWLVKAFSAAQAELKRLRSRFSSEATAQRASWMFTERARLFHDVALWTMAGVMLAWCLNLWSQNRITPGDVVLVSALTFRILHGSRDMALALIDISQQFGFIHETLRVIALPQTVTDRPAAPPLRAPDGAVELRDVSFSYEHGRDAIHGMSLRIPAGQKLGIAGVSGAGKSTLVHLIQRLSDPQMGSITIDGQLISEVTQDSLRQAIAVVPQETTLLHRSVAENILIARPTASMEEVYEAASAAQCDSFVRDLPEGYQTIIGERGTKLSGGQRQRIGIARAFLKDARIVIFDEATSALDTHSEVRIHRALLDVMRTRTVIAVAHRLSTLAGFDRVVVIDQGHIVEDGSPEDLRNANGIFAGMWRLQAEGLNPSTNVGHHAGARPPLRVVE